MSEIWAILRCWALGSADLELDHLRGSEVKINTNRMLQKVSFLTSTILSKSKVHVLHIVVPLMKLMTDLRTSNTTRK